MFLKNKYFLWLFSLLAGISLSADPLLKESEIEPLFWAPMAKAMRWVLGETGAKPWEQSINADDKKSAVSLLRNFYRAFLAKEGSMEEWSRKYESDVYGVLGEMYAASYVRNHLRKGDQIFLDGYHYQEFNPRGCKPDGLLLSKRSDGKVVIDRIIESKMDGEVGFHVGQILCSLWKWSREGVQISDSELIYPDSLLLSSQGQLWEIAKLDFENLDSITAIATSATLLFGAKNEIPVTERKIEYVPLPLQTEGGWAIARMFIGLLYYPQMESEVIWERIKDLPRKPELEAWMRAEKSRRYIEQLKFLMDKEKRGSQPLTLARKFESYQKVYPIAQTGKRYGLRMIDPKLTRDGQFEELVAHIKKVGDFPKASQGPESKKHQKFLSELGGQPGVFILLDEEIQDALFEKGNMPAKYPLQMRILASPPTYKTMHALVLYFLTYDLDDSEGMLDTLRKRDFLWKVALRNLSSRQVIHSESVESSTLNTMIGCAQRLTEFWTSLKSAWHRQN
jgi:hypothetical protein